MNNYKYTDEELLSLPETKERLKNYGDEDFIKLKIKTDLARTKIIKKTSFITQQAALVNQALVKVYI